MNPAIATGCDGREQAGRDVDVIECAAHTGICDCGDGALARRWVVDRDLLVAEWVVVWVAAVARLHYAD